MEKQDEEVSPQELLKRVQVLLEGSPEVEAAQRETLRNVYVFGSRVHQCHQPDADYDLIAIVEGPYFEGAPPTFFSFFCFYIYIIFIYSYFYLYIWHSRVVAWLMAKRHTRAEVDRGGRSQREPVP